MASKCFSSLGECIIPSVTVYSVFVSISLVSCFLHLVFFSLNNINSMWMKAEDLDRNERIKQVEKLG